jgi:hypothetical protein
LDSAAIQVQRLVIRDDAVLNSEPEWAALSVNVQSVVIRLVGENRRLKLTVSKLEERRRRNSRKSSQPLSQDQPEQKPSQEEPTRQPRQRGGQAGHASVEVEH